MLVAEGRVKVDHIGVRDLFINMEDFVTLHRLKGHYQNDKIIAVFYWILLLVCKCLVRIEFGIPLYRVGTGTLLL